MTNGDIEVVLVPEIARIMRFGRPGGPNALWTSPLADSCPMAGWINWGGDKIWFWPQSDWPKNCYNEFWPPPMDGFSAEAEPSADGLTWHQSSLPLFPGVTISRTIQLPPQGAEVRLLTTVDSSGGTLRPWSVTQIACPGEVMVEELAGGGDWIAMNEHPFAVPEKCDTGWLLRPDASGTDKYGFAAAKLSATTSAGLLSIRTEVNDPAVDAAQICFEGDDPKKRLPSIPRYAELEFAAATGVTRLVQTWTLACGGPIGRNALPDSDPCP